MKMTEMFLAQLERETPATRTALERVPAARNDRVLSEQPRHIMIADGVFSHLAHHRGQLTVYLRLNDIPVPPIYGATADERH